jgi:hypothetical protein
MNDLTADAINAFHRYVEKETAQYANTKNFRTGGRPSKDWPNGEDREWWTISGPDHVRSWIDWRNANPNLRIAVLNDAPAIEVAVQATFASGVVLKGYVDRVFQDQDSGDYLIVDLKTGRNAPPSSLQLDFYRVALQQTVGVDARFGAYWMSRKGTLSAIQELWRDEAMIADWLTKTRVMIDNEFFIPHITSMCGSCGVKDACYATNPIVIPPYNNTNTMVTE